jgi:hypothetical protein
MFFTCQSLGSVNDWNEMLEEKKHNNYRNYPTREWYGKYLSQYSGSHLTRPAEDRLIALSGVMTEYLESLAMITSRRSERPQLSQDGEDTSSWWHCGLWKFDLHDGLMWQMTSSTKEVRERYPQYPSWSWASIAAPVSWKGWRAYPIGIPCC